MNTKISVIINTFNRPHQATDVIKSILNNTFEHFELLIIEQKGNSFLKSFIAQQSTNNKKKIEYFNLPDKGVSYAKNFGILRAKGNILAFTDDDCLVEKNWLQNIENGFTKFKGIAAVFGKTMSYKPHKHPNLKCPCTFKVSKIAVVDKIKPHWKYVGFGNNMAIKREMFNKFGLFKIWLGSGSMGMNAEDAEYILRLLYNKQSILVNPDMRVYHNRWLTKVQEYKLNLTYTCGETASYSYYLLKNAPNTSKILLNQLVESYSISIKALKESKSLIKSVKIMLNIIIQFTYQTRGFLLALCCHLFDK